MIDSAAYGREAVQCKGVIAKCPPLANAGHHHGGDLGPSRADTTYGCPDLYHMAGTLK
ncbi:hypothetical protein DPMN_086892 [Dreissena polymorpha]|uniref:Uncharacterized protein n=1 Tax=Dreissena polymorpha TaxID=45954 RepID=A0A9D4QVL3_DREPO|nr:hypothetical protein DPMN_086892 [Dreissena polymorpha]